MIAGTMAVSNSVSTILVDIRAKLSAGVVSRILVIIERSITTPKVEIKYCAAALTRINNVISGRSRKRNDASDSRILITLNATSGIDKNTSQLRSESTGNKVNA